MHSLSPKKKKKKKRKKKVGEQYNTPPRIKQLYNGNN